MSEGKTPKTLNQENSIISSIFAQDDAPISFVVDDGE
jgi:hypothetical protein